MNARPGRSSRSDRKHQPDAGEADNLQATLRQARQRGHRCRREQRAKAAERDQRQAERGGDDHADAGDRGHADAVGAVYPVAHRAAGERAEPDGVAEGSAGEAADNQGRRTHLGADLPQRQPVPSDDAGVAQGRRQQRQPDRIEREVDERADHRMVVKRRRGPLQQKQDDDADADADRRQQEGT
jgi:hypothetical protein